MVGMRLLVLIAMAGCASDAHSDIASAYCAYVERCVPQLATDNCQSVTAAMLRVAPDPEQCAMAFDAQSCTTGIGIHIPQSCDAFWRFAP